jgi:hypothetical protein
LVVVAVDTAIIMATAAALVAATAEAEVEPWEELDNWVRGSMGVLKSIAFLAVAAVVLVLVTA